MKKRNRRKEPLYDRFIRHVKQEETGCWRWTASLSTSGYGQLRDSPRELRAHRVSYELFKGEIPDGLWVLHTCDNRWCVNPDHLYAGTRDDNVRDIVDRARMPRGSKHHNAVLTEEQVAQIKRELLRGARPTYLAPKYGVRREVISKIKHGNRWAHVPPAGEG